MKDTFFLSRGKPNSHVTSRQIEHLGHSIQVDRKFGLNGIPRTNASVSTMTVTPIPTPIIDTEQLSKPTTKGAGSRTGELITNPIPIAL